MGNTENNEWSRDNSSKIHKTAMTPDLCDTPVYDNELLDYILNGIAQNIRIEMDKKKLTCRGLSEISGIDAAHITRILSRKKNLGLLSFIKIAYSLKVRPGSLFPEDGLQRKSNGDRFEEIVKPLDVQSQNFLLGLCADFVKETMRVKNTKS